MYFLIDADYKTQIREGVLATITRNDPQTLLRGQQIAQQEMEGYLVDRYDTSKIFIPVLPWDAAKSFATGTQVFYNNTLYVAKVNTAAGTQPTDQGQFTQEDKRNPLIVMYAVDILLYHLHSAIAALQIPEARGIRYEAAINWLKAVAAYKINPDLPGRFKPESEATGQGGSISFGSMPRRTTRF